MNNELHGNDLMVYFMCGKSLLWHWSKATRDNRVFARAVPNCAGIIKRIIGHQFCENDSRVTGWLQE